MTIYEIDQQIATILSQVDEETGEVMFDPTAIMELQMERDRKCENLALAYKNMNAEAKAIKDEIDSLSKRLKTVQNEAERAKGFLELVLGGEAFKTAKVVVGYRKSKAVEITPDFLPWALEHNQTLLRMREPEPDKTVLKKALEAGADIPGASIVEKKSMTIK